MSTSKHIETGRHIVALPSGTHLECDFMPLPITSDEPVKLAVCLHPWSWLGGRLEDPVLRLLCDPLHARDYHVLRYNSRGVGRSTGWASLTGSREAQDLQELVSYAVEALAPVKSVVILGYSYGALIASLHPALPDPPVSHILLSYSLGPRHWLTAFHGRSYTATLNTLVRDPRSNVLIIYGDSDEFTSVEAYDDWTKSLVEEAQKSETPGRIQINKIDDATHFWREREAVRQLVGIVETWLPSCCSHNH